eukprot:m.431766 g.431766  ORF g.431766 m.431766 type:complete len:471 (-) comp56741_c2_seq9:233-1645(-)
MEQAVHLTTDPGARDALRIRLLKKRTDLAARIDESVKMYLAARIHQATLEQAFQKHLLLVGEDMTAALAVWREQVDLRLQCKMHERRQRISDLTERIQDLHTFTTRQIGFEILIVVCERVLGLCSKAALPEMWAFHQGRLGMVYSKRESGDPIANVESAIRHLKCAKEVYTRAKHPEDWADVHSYLALLYTQRKLGNAADNIEASIEACTQVLELVRREEEGLRWAGAHLGLGETYPDRETGDRAENLERAIFHLETVLENPLPKEAALLPIGFDKLGLVYASRLRGDRSENLEKALECFRKGLALVPQESGNIEWAILTTDYALALADRVQGTLQANVELALRTLELAEQFPTLPRHPDRVAHVHYAYGRCYSVRVDGHRSDNLERMIHHCNLALGYFTRHDHPLKWALLQRDMGSAYAARLEGDTAANLQLALEHLENCLQVPRAVSTDTVSGLLVKCRERLADVASP